MSERPSNHPRPPATSPRWADQWLLDAFRREQEPLAERAAGSSADSAWEALLQSGMDAAAILQMACAVSACKAADLSGTGSEQAALLPDLAALRYGVVPVRVESGVLDVACSNPLFPGIEQDLSFASGRRVRISIASPAEIRAAQSRIYGSLVPRPEAPRLMSKMDSREATVTGGATAMLDRIVAEALAQRASDVHIEPKDNGLLVRLRIDGSLHDTLAVPEDLAAPLVSRLKVLANLDIADRIRPQDGRASTLFEGRQIDLRISTLPLGGRSEKVVVRILDSQVSTIDLGVLGFMPAELNRLHRLLSLNEGMILVTGPTGSGKTTTLYSALQHVQSRESNIVTVEDPIEYRLDGINQVQVNERAGLTFAAALRSILRQDPDVVLVGEIRDAETAGIAIKASMTGHLVLTTLHTNDAASAVSRLVDIGAELGALSGALKGIVAQRLVRRLCDDCSEPMALTDLPMDQQALLMGRRTDKLRRSVGCASCRGTGFRGRMVVAEVLVVTPEIQRAIARGANVAEIAELAEDRGMLTLWRAGVERVLAGSTSLHELLDNIAAPISETDTSQSDVDALLSQLLDAGKKGASTAPAPRSAASPPVQQRVIAATGSSSSAGRTRVLIVDDDREARRILRTDLEREGIAVIEAADGEAALAYARRLGPDVILTELPLPRLDGIGLLQALVGEAGAPPVLVYTSQTDDALLDWARELGALDVLSRQVEARVLIARLTTVRASAA
jgi:type II secretory ATPase GspE/PulE/Tfp pilus assembly ATPase PilB-like protein